MTCRHCNRCRASRPRGLCWNCYYRPGIRDLYPSTSKYARRGIGLGTNYHAPSPARPTAAAPGSEERLLVLMGRAARGERLWHPEDAPL